MDTYEVSATCGNHELFQATAQLPGEPTAHNWGTATAKSLASRLGLKGAVYVKVRLVPPSPLKTTLTDLVDASFDGYGPSSETPPVIGPSSGPSPASGGTLGGVE